MLRNILKVAVRNMLGQKLFSIINVLGLSIGICAGLFILIYVNDELSYDQFNKDIKTIYRINLKGRISGQEVLTSNSCPPLGPTMVDEMPEIISALRTQQIHDVVVKRDEKSFIEKDRLYFADSNFFQFFSYKLLEGDPATVLNKANSVVLTSTMARRYFGNELPIGKQITMFNDNTAYEVTGIAKDPPSNSHIKFKALLSTVGNERFTSNIWLNNGYYTYVKSSSPLNLDEMNTKLATITKAHVGPQLEQFMGVSFDQFEQQGNVYGYLLFPLAKLHLYGQAQDEPEPPGNIKYVYLFSAIGLFLIFIACINFMNLATAKSSGRAREVGLRKTLGSQRKHLIGQFLLESLIFSLVSGILAMIMIFLLLPSFNLLSGKTITLSAFYSAGPVLIVLGITLLVGLLAGSYPAFYLTAFRPTQVLKGQLQAGVKSSRFRGILVVTQLTLSILLIICTAIVYQQLRFTQNLDLGFDKEHVLVINNTGRLKDDRQAFKKNLMNLSAVVAASYTTNTFPGVNQTTVFRAPGEDVDHILGTYLADYDHVAAMGFNVIKGRPFSREFPSDTLACLVNEATVKEMGWNDPIGEKIRLVGDDNPTNLTVVGVLKDFNFESIRDKIRPILIRFLPKANQLMVRFNTSTNPSAAVATLRKQWNAIAPGEFFQYNFLDDDFNALYQSEQKMGQLFYVFTSLAIFIACLGLFGLAAFMAEQRTKEIGIRKAMGASMMGITRLLSREFTKYALIAFFLAIIPGYFIMSSWLEDFAYRITISSWVFVFSGILATVITLLTVSYQSVKAARVNPVESLKYE